MKHYKFIYIFFALALFDSCGEDIDLDEYAAQNELQGYAYNGNTFTQMGDAKNITSASVEIPIVKQSASKNEFVWLVPSSAWDGYAYSGSDGVIAKPLEEKTWISIQIKELLPSTTYYYFQSTSKYGCELSYAEKVVKTFTTTSPEAHISEIKKLGCRCVKFSVNAIGEHGICYSQTNPIPTKDDYTWVGTHGVVCATVEDGKNYYCRPYVTWGGAVIYGDATIVKTNSDSDVYANTIDLGVSVKWADRMLLAEAALPVLSQYAFAFGNTPFFESYDSYENSSSISSPSKDTDSAHDAATYWWGSKWRTPTKGEVEELNALPMTRTKVDGVEGLLIKGKAGTVYANNSIFIPDKKYWTSTYRSYSSYYFGISSRVISLYTDWDSYYHTKYIIPVQDK